ncbi:sigma-70 family RNA polymerase sigma factor [Mycobacterium sp. 360MFTsu5.1]|uniref:sigma-70 family RNA polymerase sigma factor n=1 Tax=Mycobacterium sp. 360MFTsu5.1 TaxID=1172186 RepID=UPI00035F0F92|nr:sigma-70 family RNA polymerase sigma factor [Mycobacterium sp. 360MFTsu5.1]
MTAAPAPDSELAARFVVEAVPLFDALGRGARRLTDSDADAEDLLQDTLLHAFEGFGSFRPGTNLNAWLFRILHNRWVSRHRYRQCRPAEVALEMFTASGHERSAVHRSAEVEVLDVMPDDDVVAALSELPDGARTAVFYVGIQGYTYAETAALMGVPMGTVMSRVSRGRRQLRTALSHLDRQQDSACRPVTTNFQGSAGGPQPAG